MLYNRTDGESALTLPSPTTRERPSFAALSFYWGRPANDFGEGLLGFDGIILEATQSAQVVSVTLF